MFSGILVDNQNGADTILVLRTPTAKTEGQNVGGYSERGWTSWFSVAALLTTDVFGGAKACGLGLFYLGGARFQGVIRRGGASWSGQLSGFLGTVGRAHSSVG